MNQNELLNGAMFLNYDPEDKEITSDVIVSYGDKSVKVRALWDTGANKSCIAASVVEELVVTPHRGIQRITDISTTTDKVYLLDLLISPALMLKNYEMVGTSIGSRVCRAIIGMDIISKGQFIFVNNDGKYFALYKPEDSDCLDKNVK